jgi:uncharacterized protein with GYD domain
MLQASYTADAKTALAAKPQDRQQGVAALIERLEGKLESLYFCVGEYDVMVIFEAPDTVTAVAASLAAASPGHLAKVLTTPLLTNDEMMRAMEKASRQAYKGPSRA